jgi:NitT/TauT family transport system substrate-binding protein
MRKSKLSWLLVVILLLAAVAPLATPARAQDLPTLKMGLLPILDVLPFYVADQQGYFEEEGVAVELIPVSSALERDQLLIAGEIDGMLNDLVSTGIFNQDEPVVQIVAQARRAYEDHPQIRILAAPRSNITIVEDLRGKEIGISENSLIHYVTQRVLEEAGLPADQWTYRAEPNIPVRFQLLMEGQMPVVTLPDPLAQAAIEGGAILIADDTALVEQEFSQSVLSFRTTVIEDQPEAVEAFLRAWMRAADDINADPDAYRDLWLENTNVPDSVRDTYVLPPFPTFAITGEEAWTDTMQWLVDLDIIEEMPGYEGSVNPTFLENIQPAEEVQPTEEPAPPAEPAGDDAEGGEDTDGDGLPDY